MIETNEIKELFPGHFQVILDFPEPKDLMQILDLKTKYIWGLGHNEGRSSWQDYDHTLFGEYLNSKKVLARNVQMEFLIDTLSFLELTPSIKQTVNLVQTDVIPPAYINLARLKGKQKYNLFKDKLKYRLEVEIPGASDYGKVVSTDFHLLERIIKQIGHSSN